MAKCKSVPYTGSVLGAVEGALSEIDELRGEMEAWRDGLEEKLSHTEKYQQVSDAYDALDDAHGKLEGIEIPEDFDPSITYVEMRPYGRKPMPRWMRWNNVQSMLSAALEAIQNREEPEETDEDNDEDTDDTDWSSIENDLEEALNVDVEFPGMY